VDTVTEQRRDRDAPGNTDATRRGFRPDIQALRAIAVLAVVVNHIWPEHLAGGYVGVDVFFVISGFLISSHLDREITGTGRVRLGRFYARRMRRLLPAAFLVIACCLVAAYYLLPYPRWEQTAQEGFAAASYWENWLLALHSVDYSAADAAASLVQHYWSLSVEEQFYLFWPLLMWALFKIRHRPAQLTGMVLVFAGSLYYSIHLTEVSPNEAYFVTPVRVWEFALGAIVALTAGMQLRRRRERVRTESEEPPEEPPEVLPAKRPALLPAKPVVEFPVAALAASDVEPAWPDPDPEATIQMRLPTKALAAEEPGDRDLFEAYVAAVPQLSIPDTVARTLERSWLRPSENGDGHQPDTAAPEPPAAEHAPPAERPDLPEPPEPPVAEPDPPASPASPPRSSRIAEWASFVGLAMIISSAFLFDEETPFPGYLALIPTLGTALMIIAGHRGERQWHSVVTSSKPVQLVGDVSYSLYLWHWPLILVAPFALGDLLTAGRLTLPYQLGILGAALLLSILTKYLVEDGFRRWQPLVRSTRVTVIGMVVGLVVIAMAAYALTWTYDEEVAKAEQEAERAAAAAAKRTPPCLGASAMIPEHRCKSRFGPAKVVEMGPVNEYYKLADGCRSIAHYQVNGKRTTVVCDFSDGRPDPEVVWLIGDSHAQQWQSPLFDLARERKWVLKLGFLGGCPFAKIHFAGYAVPGADNTSKQACMDWTAKMADVIADDEPAAVVMTFYARREFADDGSGRSQTKQYRDGLQPYWRMWTDAGARVVVLADPPLNGAVREVDCVVINPDDPKVCAVDRKVAQPPDPLVEAARSTRMRGVRLVDLTDYFCDERRCYAVVGNVTVYFDANHLNREFSRSLKPMIERSLTFK
jgi:peptidoglycan/LPS O-acetylase OafA/YrhL